MRGEGNAGGEEQVVPCSPSTNTCTKLMMGGAEHRCGERNPSPTYTYPAPLALPPHLVEANVSWWRPDELGDGVLLHVFTHVESHLRREKIGGIIEGRAA